MKTRSLILFLFITKNISGEKPDNSYKLSNGESGAWFQKEIQLLKLETDDNSCLLLSYPESNIDFIINQRNDPYLKIYDEAHHNGEDCSMENRIYKFYDNEIVNKPDRECFCMPICVEIRDIHLSYDAGNCKFNWMILAYVAAAVTFLVLLYFFVKLKPVKSCLTEVLRAYKKVVCCPRNLYEDCRNKGSRNRQREQQKVEEKIEMQRKRNELNRLRQEARDEFDEDDDVLPDINITMKKPNFVILDKMSVRNEKIYKSKRDLKVGGVYAKDNDRVTVNQRGCINEGASLKDYDVGRNLSENGVSVKDTAVVVYDAKLKQPTFNNTNANINVGGDYKQGGNHAAYNGKICELQKKGSTNC